MAIVAGRTRRQIRQAVGYNVGALFVGSTTSAGGDTSSLIDNKLRGGNDDHIGKWIVSTSGTNDGEITRVDDYVAASFDATVVPAFTNTVPSGMSYEMWKDDYPPAMINEFINAAILDAYGRAFDPEESVALHLHPDDYRYAVPAEFAMIRRLDYRRSVSADVVHNCNSAWDESTDADVTASADTEDRREGGASLKLVVVGTVSAGDVLATDNITSLNISDMDFIECWVKVTTAVAASDLALLLDNTASCASPLETLNIPAISADTWTYVRLALSTPELDTAIISVGLEYNANPAANTIWIDGIRAVSDRSGLWERVPPHHWRVDREAREIVFSESPPYALMKIVGGDEPALLSADSDACEIDDWYVICRATELAFSATSGGSQTDRDDRRRQAMMWAARADDARRSFPMLVNARMV